MCDMCCDGVYGSVVLPSTKMVMDMGQERGEEKEEIKARPTAS